MRGFVLRFLVNMLALWLTAYIARSLGLRVEISSFWAAFFGTIALSVVNATLGSILRLITMPLNCMTLGLIGILINVLLFWLVGSGIIPGFEVIGFWAALFGSVVMGLINGILQSLVEEKKT